MKLLIKIILIFLISSSCIAQDAPNQSKIKYHIEKVQNYLDKEKSLSKFYTIDDEGITIFASAVNKKNNLVEYHINWNQLSNFNEGIKTYPLDVIQRRFVNGKYQNKPNEIYKRKKYPTTEKRLKGFKIAIDPGHIANTFIIGELEKKYLKIKTDSIHGVNDSIELAEGMLTNATAKLLKEKLESEGADVFLTRTNELCAFGKTFEQWKKDDFKNAVDSLFKIKELSTVQKEYFMSKKAKDRDIFRVIFKDLELAKRAELINRYSPDFTVIIHYNVDETNLGWVKTSAKDFNMTFVAGAFMKNDLSSKDKRFEFLRLLASDDIEKSITLSSAVVKNFENTLKIKTAKINDAKYLLEGCMPTSQNGVFCRNLQLTRFIHSPLIYGETLYQDNLNESQLLNMETDKTKNKRVQQVADAYFMGILDYVNLNSN
jgi:N-acetylmuramoyl-L-alanine amidase